MVIRNRKGNSLIITAHVAVKREKRDKSSVPGGSSILLLQFSYRLTFSESLMDFVFFSSTLYIVGVYSEISISIQ